MEVLVSLVSAQTVPNVLFIKAFPKFDKHLFLSTEEMEKFGKSSAIVKACEIDEDRVIIHKIAYDDYHEVLNDLKRVKGLLSNNCRYTVNITGGTKIMALAATEFFKRISNSKIYYLPFNDSYLQKIHPLIERIILPDSPPLDLNTYFAAHGFEFVGENNLEVPFQETRTLFKKVQKAGNASKVEELSTAYRRNYVDSSAAYLRGGWFEQFIYGSLKHELELPDSMIKFNLKMKATDSPLLTESDNEVDVAFMFKNRLYLIECKVYLSQMRKKIDMTKIQDPMFKIASIRNNLGLSANCTVTFGCLIGNRGIRAQRLNQLKRLLNISNLIDLESLEKPRGISNLLNLN